MPTKARPIPGAATSRGSNAGGTVAPSDEELLLAVANHRDGEAFSELFRRHGGSAFAIARQITGDVELASDAVQEAMLQVWRCAHHFRPGLAKSWLHSIVTRCAYSSARHQRKIEKRHEALRSERGLSEEGPPGLADGQSEVASALNAVVAALSVEDRVLLAYYFGANCSQEEISKKLKLSQRAVSDRLSRVLNTLKVRLTQAGFAAALPLLEGHRLGVALYEGRTAPVDLEAKIQSRLDLAARKTKAGAVAKTVAAGLALALCAALGLAMVLTQRATEGAAPVRELERSPLAETGTQEAPTPLRGPATARFRRHWDFDSSEQMGDFERLLGSVEILPGKGVGGGGCLEFGRVALLQFRLPAKYLFLKVSFSFRYSTTDETQGINATWPGLQYYACFRNIGDRLTPQDVSRNWHRSIFYLTATSTEHWVAGLGRIGVYFIQARESGRGVILESANRALIDELVVEEIGAAEVPDLAVFSQAHARLAPSAVPGQQIPVPWLNQYASGGKQVFFLRTAGGP